MGTCASCGSVVEPGGTFCTTCGARVGAAAPDRAMSVGAGAGWRSRPAAVVVLSIMTVLTGVGEVGAGFMLAMATQAAGWAARSIRQFGIGGAEEPPFWLPFLSYAVSVLGAVMLAAGYGLFFYERWAPRLSRAAWLVTGLGALFLLFQGTRTSVLMGLLGLATVGAVVYYLSRAEAQGMY